MSVHLKMFVVAFLFSATFLAGTSIVFAAWQGTTWITTGSVIDATKIKDNFDYLYSQAGTSQWTTSGANIYFNTGNVGVGMNSPGARLDVRAPSHGLSAGAFQIISKFVGAPANSRGLNIYTYNSAASTGWNNSVIRLSSSVDGAAYPMYTGTSAVYNNLSWIDLGVNNVNEGYTSFGFGPGDSQTTAMTILKSGNVGIGTTTPAQKLDVAGTAQAAAFVYSSDRSLKDHIMPLSNTSAILDVEPKRFVWRETNKEDVGIIAQDVEKVFPEFVHENDNGIKTVDYAKLVVPLLGVVREQQKEIDELKARLNAVGI